MVDLDSLQLGCSNLVKFKQSKREVAGLISPGKKSCSLGCLRQEGLAL
jgi:hypothetical protein